MLFELKMPDLATNDSPIRIVRWMVRTGDTVTRGQPLLEAETDKATLEVESAVHGRLEKVLCTADDEVWVGQVIAVLEVEERAAIANSAGPQDTTPPPVASQCSGETSDSAARKPGGMFARNRDALNAASVPAAGIPLSLAQRIAAERLQKSKQTVPHIYLQAPFNAAMIVAYRQAAGPNKPAWDAFFVLAVARAIRRFDRFRSRLDDHRLVPAGTDAIGVAADVDEELFVIPVQSPVGKSVEQISDEIRHAVERLRSGDAEARCIRSALMTVTNLGICNVESFVPIINPPETAILGVGKVRLSPVVEQDGTVAVQPRGTLTLSVDHRVASGKYAAEFLDAIVTELEAGQIRKDLP